jgi:multisubunit Na+/H+ antiporter MnhE subunit
MPAPHALYSKMLAERAASRNVLVLFYLYLYLFIAVLERALSVAHECLTPHSDI